VHIPVLADYWADSLEVLRLFFSSLFENTQRPFDLMVFDNNSCREVQDYLLALRTEGLIQYLILSEHNLRKLGALNFLLCSAPGEFIAFADSDVYFLPGWLEKSLEVLDAFPQAAKVTALPVAGGDTTQISAAAYAKAQADPKIKIETGLIVDDLFLRAHLLSLGQSEQHYHSRIRNRKDTLLIRDGVEALLSTADFQFILRSEALEMVLPLKIESDDEYYDPIYSPLLERRLDEAGLWQLSTPDYLVHHMGNTVPNLTAEIPWVKWRDNQESKTVIHKASKKEAISNPTLRRIIHKIHSLSYKLLYE
jgi:glycosyltransferase involved in cell wall biosynthesis